MVFHYPVNNGAEPALANADETRPIHYYARQNIALDQLPCYSKALNLLLAKGADLNHTNRYPLSVIAVASWPS